MNVNSWTSLDDKRTETSLYFFLTCEAKRKFLRAITCKPRPNVQDPVQSSFLDLTDFYICDRVHCVTNFDANRIKKILNRYCFIELFRKVLNFDTTKGTPPVCPLTLRPPIIRPLQFVPTKFRPLTICLLTVRPIYNSFHLHFVPLQFVPLQSVPYTIRSLQFVPMYFVPIFLSRNFIKLISVILQKQE